MVSIKELPRIQVVYLHVELDVAAGKHNPQISAAFGAVKTWAMRQGHNPMDGLTIGIPQEVDRRLVGYDCCLEMPGAAVNGQDDVAIKTIPGGRYAVLKLEKDWRTIESVIGRFYAEYVPEHHLALDVSRPTYEIYGARRMEYCVPVM